MSLTISTVTPRAARAYLYLLHRDTQGLGHLPLQRLAELQNAQVRHLGGRDGNAAATYPRVKGQMGGVHIADNHLVQGQAQPFGYHPADHGVRAGTRLHHRHLRLDAAVGLEPQANAATLGGVRGAVVDRHAAAEAHRARRVRGKHRSVSRLRQIQGRYRPYFGPVVAEGARLTIPEQVIAAEGDGIHTQLSGHQVQHRLHGKGELRGARRPRVAPRHLVGVDPLGHHPYGRYIVAAGCSGAEVDARTESPIGAAVKDRVYVHCLQPAVTAHSNAHTDHRGVAWRCSHELLGVAHGHAHRPPGASRQLQAQGDVHGGALAAKVCAHGRGVQGEVLYGNAERGAQLLPQPVGRLVARPDFDAAIGCHCHRA